MKMYNFARLLAGSFLMAGITWYATLSADNQTPTVSEIHSDHSLPFRIKLKKADFKLPMGVQTYVHGMHGDKVLIITGRIDGLHGFVSGSKNNFPSKLQNTSVFVLDLAKKKTYIRSLLDPESGLTQNQVDLLSVTAAQAYQSGKTLYIAGGYGVDTATGRFNTKDALTAIDLPGLIHWVTNPCDCETAAEHIRQIFDDTFKVTGGYMNKVEGDHPTLLVMGHEFNGFYNDPTQLPPVFQQYTEQVRRFRIIDDGINLSIIHENPLPTIRDPNYHRRDLNVVPIVKKENHQLEQSFAALSGVFTPTTGIWTVPVEVTADGVPSMADPNLPSTFKQGMNSYDCATFGMFSEKTGEMYTILLGGISFGFFEETSDGFQFKTDDRIPFISQTTTLKIDKHGKYTQHFMKHGGFPLILSKTVNRGNSLLFGSECEAVLLNKIHKYSNDVLKLDYIKKPTVIGYVIGGIQSTVPNTSSQADSSTSKYIFKIIVEPVFHHCNASD